MMHGPAPDPDSPLFLPPLERNFLCELLWDAYQESHADFLTILPVDGAPGPSGRTPFGFFVIKDGEWYDYRYPFETDIPPPPDYAKKFERSLETFGKRSLATEDREKFPEGTFNRAAVDTSFAPLAWMAGEHPQAGILSLTVLDRAVFQPNTLRLPWLTRNQVTAAWMTTQYTLCNLQRELPPVQASAEIMEGFAKVISVADEVRHHGVEPVAMALLEAFSPIGVTGIQLFDVRDEKSQLIAAVGSLQSEIFNTVPQAVLDNGNANFEDADFISLDLMPTNNLGEPGIVWHAYLLFGKGVAICLDRDGSKAVSRIEQIAATCILERSLWLISLKIAYLSF